GDVRPGRGVLPQAEERVPIVRASVVVPPEEAEAAVARLLELVPSGHEVGDAPEGQIELAVYVEEADLEPLLAEFPAVTTIPIVPGWEDRWRRFHNGVCVGPLWVGPPWEQPPAGAVTVVIEPGRAFGTGAHATTRLALELLADLEPGSLLDVGCGSGVVAIAACRLGFRPVRAGDTDPAALEATRENAARNDVSVDVGPLDARTDELDADVIVANIGLDVVEVLAPRVRCRNLVLSGYLEVQQPSVSGLVHLARRERDGWAADAYGRE
ncbi:MAG: 50S ribosomal protein L11 methyltransferase, partial [Gaiellaceae bacterium]